MNGYGYRIVYHSIVYSMLLGLGGKYCCWPRLPHKPRLYKPRYHRSTQAELWDTQLSIREGGGGTNNYSDSEKYMITISFTQSKKLFLGVNKNTPRLQFVQCVAIKQMYFQFQLLSANHASFFAGALIFVKRALKF